jgi:hypothetical protein
MTLASLRLVVALGDTLSGGSEVAGASGPFSGRRAKG